MTAATTPRPAEAADPATEGVTFDTRNGACRVKLPLIYKSRQSALHDAEPVTPAQPATLGPRGQSAAPPPTCSAALGVTYKSWRKRVGLLLLAATVGFAAGASVLSLSGQKYELSHSDSLAAGRQDTSRANLPAWLSITAGFLHTFGTGLYAVTAPIDLAIMVRYYRAHRRRLPRICVCGIVASIGGILCLLGWLLAHWICTLGLTAVVAAHAVSIVAERWKPWTRRI